MGLDQYAWALEKRPEKDTDFGDSDDWITDKPFPDCFREDPVYGQLFATKDGAKAIAYWRKHPNLHGLIQGIYVAKGGKQLHMGSFAGPVVLDLPDIHFIEKVTEKDALPHTEGFFFGQSQPEDKELTLEFCRRARAEIERGWTVIYDSSW